ncbi:MAG: hypothetical protein IPM24_22920 [Bryobacterales bacterium]|nr:hypothetical protein [Bryobacterales bacterium]
MEWTANRVVRPQDIVWIILFSVMGWLSVARHPLEFPLLAALAILQVVEPRSPWFQTRQGSVSVNLLKIGLSYLLIGFTGGVTSSYYLLLLLPLVSAATMFGPVGTTLFTLVAGGAYVSFLLFLDWSRYRVDADQLKELALRLLVFAVIGFLVNTLGASAREQAGRYREVAEQLAVANRNLVEAEAAVRRSDRLAALGQLSAGLAHELRNPLGTIRASAEVLSKSLNGSEHAVAREMAGFIVSEADRTNLLVTRFLDFARPLRPELSRCEIGDVIDRAIGQIRRGSPRPDVAIYKNFAPEVGPVYVDPDLMERVFYNLLLNAAEATEERGEITVKTRGAGGLIEVAVIDRGAGIAPENLENIFNPFFTTKAEGVGLGLPVVSKIVDEHSGKIAVESTPGKGSVFRVYLPAGPPASSETAV